VDQWIIALEQEMDIAARTFLFDLHTIYIGGGTPSVLEPKVFKQMHAALLQHVTIAPSIEWTIEANPESINLTKVQDWAAAGVTRVSIGVQSMQNSILRKMNRLHDVDMIHQVVSILRDFPQLSLAIDLIAGFPELTDEDWQRTVETALAISPEHLSVYECTLHQGTALDKEVSAGLLCEMSPDRRDHALQVAAKAITLAGYEHYETSNFCLPGKRCQHNVAVWRGEDYVGLGPGASSRVGRQRWTNQPDVTAYVEAIDTRNFPRDLDDLTPEQDATERLIFAFRLCEPIDLRTYAPQDPNVAVWLVKYWEEQLNDLQKKGLVTSFQHQWSTSAYGRQMVDLIAEALLP